MRMGQYEQYTQPCAAFDQRAYRTGVGQTLDQVTLPMAGKLPVLDLGRAHMNAQELANLPAQVFPLARGQRFARAMRKQAINSRLSSPRG
jgi:hypothetical protein